MDAHPDGPDVGLVVAAAGAGARMGGRKKPLLELAGTPILLHALEPFLARDDLAVAVVVLPADEASRPPAWLSERDPRIHVVPGGNTRTRSVRAGLEALPEEVSVVVIHDGARPLVEPDVVDRCLRGARRGEGAVAGVPATDTIKEVDGEGRIVDTPDRSRLWHAQTPQAFPRALIVRAHRHAGDEGGATDDAGLVERVGGVVRMVRSSVRNLKVTRPGDLRLAEAYLARKAP